MSKVIAHRNVQISESPIAQFLFGDKRMAIVWLVARLWLGYQWITAVEHKLSDPAWTQTGTALKGFWTSALKTSPSPVIYFDWYRNFLQFMINIQAYTWFSKLVVAGELLVGVCLILGAFTGIAAFAGGFMNWNFMMAGSASSNPFLFTIAIGLILAWKIAGYYGVDRVLLPALGTPWKPALVLAPKQEPAPVGRPSAAE